MAEGLAVDGVILAGGLARRLGGVDKGLVPLAGRPLAAWVADRLRPQVAALAISANRNVEFYASLGCPVFADELPGHPGPLAGILAAGRRMSAPWLLVAPCDLPFLPMDLAWRLREAATQRGLGAVHAAEPGREHYAVMLLRRDLLADMADFVDGGGRQVRAWLGRSGAQAVIFADGGPAFFNVNTPEDLDRAGRLLAGGTP